MKSRPKPECGIIGIRHMAREREASEEKSRSRRNLFFFLFVFVLLLSISCFTREREREREIFKDLVPLLPSCVGTNSLMSERERAQ